MVCPFPQQVYSFIIKLTMPWLVSTKGAHWTTSRPWSSRLSIPVTVHFLEDLERNLTSDPAWPPLSPLSTSEPCLACEAWALW